MKYLISFLILTLAMVAASAAPSLGTGDWTPAEKEDGAAQDLEEQFQSNERFKSVLEEEMTRLKDHSQNYKERAQRSKNAGNKFNDDLFTQLAEYTNREVIRLQKLIDSS